MKVTRKYKSGCVWCNGSGIAPSTNMYSMTKLGWIIFITLISIILGLIVMAFIISIVGGIVAVLFITGGLYLGLKYLVK